MRYTMREREMREREEWIKMREIVNERMEDMFSVDRGLSWSVHVKYDSSLHAV